MHRDLRVKQVTEIIQRNSDIVYRLAFSMVKTTQDAEDIHQEVFIKFLRKNPCFESLEHEKAWFIRVTANLCKNLWKTAWRQKMVSIDAFEMAEDCAERNARQYNSREKDNITTKSAPCDQAELTDEEERIVETVKRLPGKYRVVIHLFYYEEMSIEEIAGALKLQPSNVRTRLTRARKMLKEWLKEDV